MKRLALTLLLLAGLAPAAMADTPLGSLEGSWPRGETTRLRVDFPVGELRIETVATETIRATLWARCERRTEACVERSRKLQLVTDVVGRTRRVELKGFPRLSNKGLQVELIVEVPRGMAVEVDMGVGELVVRGVDGDLEMNLGVGEVDVRLPRQDIGNVDLEVGVGELTLDADGRSRNGAGFLGHSLKWSGSGRKRVAVECGVGEVSVRLE